jgi:hypothetical protein
MELLRNHIANGRAVIPVSNKQAKITWGPFQKSLPTDLEINSWLKIFFDGIALITGGNYGIWVLDCDGPGAVEWAKKNAKPTNIKTKTGKGEHWYYKTPLVNGEYIPIKGTTGIIKGEGWQIDIRGDGNYVVIPLSHYYKDDKPAYLTIDGKRYPITYDWILPEGTSHQEPTEDDWDSLPVWDPPIMDEAKGILPTTIENNEPHHTSEPIFRKSPTCFKLYSEAEIKDIYKHCIKAVLSHYCLNKKSFVERDDRFTAGDKYGNPAKGASGDGSFFIYKQGINGVRPGYWEDRATNETGDLAAFVMAQENCDFPSAMAIIKKIGGYSEPTLKLSPKMSANLAIASFGTAGNAALNTVNYPYGYNLAALAPIHLPLNILIVRDYESLYRVLQNYLLISDILWEGEDFYPLVYPVINDTGNAQFDGMALTTFPHKFGRVMFCLDNDNAGRNAINDFFGVLQQALPSHFEVKKLVFEGGETGDNINDWLDKEVPKVITPTDNKPALYPDRFPLTQNTELISLNEYVKNHVEDLDISLGVLRFNCKWEGDNPPESIFEAKADCSQDLRGIQIVDLLADDPRWLQDNQDYPRFSLVNKMSFIFRGMVTYASAIKLREYYRYFYTVICQEMIQERQGKLREAGVEMIEPEIVQFEPRQDGQSEVGGEVIDMGDELGDDGGEGDGEGRLSKIPEQFRELFSFKKHEESFDFSPWNDKPGLLEILNDSNDLYYRGPKIIGYYNWRCQENKRLAGQFFFTGDPADKTLVRIDNTEIDIGNRSRKSRLIVHPISKDVFVTIFDQMVQMYQMVKNKKYKTAVERKEEQEKYLKSKKTGIELPPPNEKPEKPYTVIPIKLITEIAKRIHTGMTDRDIKAMDIAWLEDILYGPGITPDGHVIDKPGYDDDTRMLYAPIEGENITVPEFVSRDEALKSLDFLRDVYKEFFFYDGDDTDSEGLSLSVALAATITPFVRPFIEIAPLFVFTSTDAACGKSLLCEAIALIGAHETINALQINFGKGDEQVIMRQLIGHATQKHKVIRIDNANGIIGSNVLCEAITSPIISGPVLYSQAQGQFKNKMTVLLTGRNTKFKDDLDARTNVCRLANHKVDYHYQREDF